MISEFLIGNFAFGTAANLNLTCHAVREETLPVLYETLCLDGRRPAVRDYLRRQELNPGLIYTKYVYRCISCLSQLLSISLRFLVFDGPKWVDLQILLQDDKLIIIFKTLCSTVDDEGRPSKLPNLIMGIQVHVHHSDARLSKLNPERDVQYLTACHLWLYASLSARVAFLILKTPVWVRRPRDLHAEISNSVKLPTTGSGGVDKYSRTCDYPVFILDGLHLAPGGALKNHHHVGLDSVTLDLCLYSAFIYCIERSSRSSGQDVETALALLTLLGMQTHQNPARTLDQSLGAIRSRHCMHTWYLVPYHLTFTLKRVAVESFIDKVSRESSIEGIGF